MSPADGFDPLRSALERAGVRYAVGGSWASTAFGEPRFTNDVDILADFTAKNLQWRDIKGIVRGCSATLDRTYLEGSANELQIVDLLRRALNNG